MGHDPQKYVAPADAEELYRKDGAYIQGLARKLLGASGNSQDAEDAAADIMEKLLTAKNAEGLNALQQYNPGFVSEHTSQNVTWRAFLSHKVALYMRGKREQVARRYSREPLLCDMVTGENGTRWVELFAPEHWDDYPWLSDDEFADRMRNYLATVTGDWGGPVSLLAVFTELAAHLASGEAGAPLHRLGLSRGDAKKAIEHIRAAVQEAADAPSPGDFCIAGVSLSAAEVREAVDLLKAGKGNHVHVPLKAHRLQLEAPKGWYHEYSAAERKLYPDCCMDPQTHAKPADHVKRAVIHRMERELASAGRQVLPPAEPVSPVSREELLEAEVWRVRGMDAAGVDAVLSIVRKLYT